jgi:putative hemolysin
LLYFLWFFENKNILKQGEILMNAIILLIILIALNAMFAATEIAVISMNDVKLKNMAEGGDKRAIRLVNLTEQPARFLSTIQVAITLASLLQSAVAAETFADQIVDKLLDAGVSIAPGVLHGVSIVVITLILSYFTLVFGELVPKRVAMKKTELIALGMSGILYGVAKAFAPIVWLLTKSTNGILRILRINPEEEDSSVTEESIKMMLAEGKEKGVIQPEEDELIQNIFEFDDITAEEMCTHRRDVIALSLSDDFEEWKKTIRESRHTKYPVCGDNLDDIVGVLDTRDYFMHPAGDKQQVVDNTVEKAMLVPESMKANSLFRKMQENREYFAVVIDEYGGMSGIVTLHDIMEALLGDLSEKESPIKPEEIEKLSEDKFVIQGSADLEDVAEALDIEMPIDVYDTFSGFICGVLGRIPEEGEKFKCQWEDWTITAHNVKHHIVESATIERVKEQE